MYWSFLEDLLPNETYYMYVENIKSTNKIHEFVIFNQTTKIDAHEEKYFHSKCQTQEYQHIYF
jgi:predicted transposase YdaD